MANNSPTL
jgi:hypothetical protein